MAAEYSQSDPGTIGFLIGRELIHDDGTRVILNKALYGDSALATDSKVPGRIKGRHEAYRKITCKEHIINAARHGDSEFADVTLASDGHTYLCKTREGGGAAAGGAPPSRVFSNNSRVYNDLDSSYWHVSKCKDHGQYASVHSTKEDDNINFWTWRWVC